MDDFFTGLGAKKEAKALPPGADPNDPFAMSEAVVAPAVAKEAKKMGAARGRGEGGWSLGCAGV
jgi:hypothetical protein